jgi:hypothetical protein
MIYNCQFCTYKTDRTYNLRRHYKTKHDCDIPDDKIETLQEPEMTNGHHVTFEMAEETFDIVEGTKKLYTCKKCKKGYNTKKLYENHENKCNFLDALTCPKCMMRFANKNGKSRHIIRNNCKARSIIHSNIPDVLTTVQSENVLSKAYNSFQTQNNNCTNNIQTQNNNCQQTINNIYLNNYGNERLDHLDHEKCMQIFSNNYDIPSIMTKQIHFNPEFPENNNIRFVNDKTAMIKSEDQYVYRNINELVEEIIKEKTRYIQTFAKDNKENICARLSTEIYEEIIELCLRLIIMKEPSSQYRRQVNNIMDMIKTSHKQLSQFSQ